MWWRPIDDPEHAEAAAIISDDPGPLASTERMVIRVAHLPDRELDPDAEASLDTSITDGDLEVEDLGTRTGTDP